MKPQTLSAEFVAQALKLPTPPAELCHVFGTVTTDSRKIQPGCLFVALKGDSFDGHDFIAAAVAGGAGGILCSADHPGARTAAETKDGRPTLFFRVPDSQEGFRKLGAAWRAQFTMPLIVVAGSAGKTTTKEFLAAILRGKFHHVLKTHGSQNGFVGIPLTLMELRAETEVAVIEVGIDEIGAMELHLQTTRPTASTVTAIGPEHLEKLIDVPTVAREEGYALTRVAESGGTIGLRWDDPLLKPLVESLERSARAGKAFGFGLEPIDRHGFPVGWPFLTGLLNGDRLRLSGMGCEGWEFTLPLPGRHNASNLLAALGLARSLGLTRDEIQAGLALFHGAEGRSQTKVAIDGTIVLCDYYNAQPASVSAGLLTLTELAGTRTRWACLADMLELGRDEEKFHRDLAPEIMTLQLENVLLYGRRMEWLAEELTSLGFKGKLEHFSEQSALAQALMRGYHPGEAILIKGSRSMKMEEVWKLLMPKLGPLKP